ncbi:fumarylacetoacetate hydrolase family protein [Bacillus massiliigorillae]|uniref:fumarylacetoacetate hydrolase family protein n=1 Tax=Bacillus massiliigorillae TaxID=1243664 RepID=UPI00039F9F64|nr:fumarylacetoacetate hydrolase family protein [Bacillus massiliigorillae]
MKFATVEWNNEQVVVLEDASTGQLLQIAEAAKSLYGQQHMVPTTMLALIGSGEEALSSIAEIATWAKDQPASSNLFINPSDVKWLAPIPRPTKNIFCVGKNYADHAIEMGSAADIPEHVMMFTKTPTTVIGHENIIPIHSALTEQMDYEGELAVIIGKKGVGIKEAEANDYIFGYTILNDVTARDIQSRHKQFFLGKSLDGTCPMGPFIVHKSQIEHPLQLNVQTTVNGELRQNGNTNQFIFSIPKIIEVISSGMTLEPGDIIATGTPAGVGKGFKPPKFLRAGDVIEITIENIGTLCNKID